MELAGLIFEITIVRFDPLPQQSTLRFPSAQPASAALVVPAEPEFFVRASAVTENVCWGEFELWCSGDHARARILEHREHDAFLLSSATPAGEGCSFRDEDGMVFFEPAEAVIPAGMGVNALRAWLIDIKHPDFLIWS